MQRSLRTFHGCLITYTSVHTVHRSGTSRTMIFYHSFSSHESFSAKLSRSSMQIERKRCSNANAYFRSSSIAADIKISLTKHPKVFSGLQNLGSCNRLISCKIASLEPAAFFCKLFVTNARSFMNLFNRVGIH